MNWVNTKDRQPEQSGLYLAHLGRNKRDKFAVLYFDQKKQAWEPAIDGMELNVPVIHWIDIPPIRNP